MSEDYVQAELFPDLPVKEKRSPYVMNPDEDVVLPGSMLKEGMRVLDDGYRHGDRSEEFYTVTLLRHLPAQSGGFTGSDIPERIAFVAVYEDGFQKGRSIGSHCHWIVKKDSIPTGFAMADEFLAKAGLRTFTERADDSPAAGL